ncbi:MAG: U32 family peptidase [Treponema sp.]|nr:U32 family peptidase [Treponema sp.]
MSELLAPAGNVEALDAAIGEGADAVYLGLKSFNARLRSSNFAWNQFEGAVQSLHRQGKKIYVTVNTVSEESETERLYRFLSYLEKIGPDGLIVQDFGVVRMVQEFFPKLTIHASTQMNVESAAAANLLHKQGLSRVVVARELGLKEIKYIKEHTKAELEMFVHGALCVSESGLCMFSSYLGGKSANRGMCTQACRRFYTANTESGGEVPGYYFSPADLQLIDHIPDLMDIGIDSFKIEGRMKSAEYVGSVVAAYRYLMDHYKEDKKGAIAAAKRILATDFARKKTTYWYNFDNPEDGVVHAGEAVLDPKQAGGTGIYLGKIVEQKTPPKKGFSFDNAQNENQNSSENPMEMDNDEEKTNTKNVSGDDKPIKMAVISGGSYDPDPGDSIRLHRHDDTGRVSHKVRTVEIDEEGKRWIDVPVGFSRGDDVYLLQTKSMSKRYPRVLPNDIGKFRTQPGAEKLPIMDLTPVQRNELSYFPEGVYIELSTINDLFLAQSEHPVRYVLDLNNETKGPLLSEVPGGKPVLPVSKKMVILSLDPYLPASLEEDMQNTLNALVEKGYSTFIVNNLAQIEMLRGKTVNGKKVNLIGGPYLYTFNRWAVSFLENQDIGAFITPLENSEKNLEATFDSSVRSRVMVSVFAYPTLFRIRFRLPKDYDFTYFMDKEETVFKVVSGKDGSFVMPEIPFSIVDRTAKLNSKGFTRILIDYSHTKVRKGDLKQIIGAMMKSQPLPETNRFNWKNGFYSPELMEEYRASNERAAAARKMGLNTSSRPERKNNRPFNNRNNKKNGRRK